MIKIVGAIFEKIKIFNFFLMWTAHNFRGRGKTKKTAGDTYKRTLDIEFERDRSIFLGSTFGDGHTDRQTNTHTQTFFLKHIFRLWEWCRTKNHKKIEVEFFDDCTTFFNTSVARKYCKYEKKNTREWISLFKKMFPRPILKVTVRVLLATFYLN